MTDTGPAVAGTDDAQAETWYRVDSEDRIVGVGGGWRTGAPESGAEAAGPSVIGTSLYDHVAGHFTRKFLKDFLRRARESPVAPRRTYRCDSPQAKRLMEMRAEACDPGVLQVTHRALDERPLPFPIRFEEVGKRAIAGVLRCSLCNRLRRKLGDIAVWREPETCVAPDSTTRVVHTVCQDCRNGIAAKDRWIATPK
jgi:hypothetical protein